MLVVVTLFAAVAEVPEGLVGRGPENPAEIGPQEAVEMRTDFSEIKGLGFRSTLQPDATGDEIRPGLPDPGVRKERIEFEGIDQDLDPMSQPKFLAPFDVDDPEDPLAVLLPDLDEIGMIRPAADKVRIESELREKS